MVEVKVGEHTWRFIWDPRDYSGFKMLYISRDGVKYGSLNFDFYLRGAQTILEEAVKQLCNDVKSEIWSERENLEDEQAAKEEKAKLEVPPSVCPKCGQGVLEKVRMQEGDPVYKCKSCGKLSVFPLDWARGKKHGKEG